MVGDKIKKIIKKDNNKKLKPSKELLEALKEANDIRNGKIKTKGYRNVSQMFEDILAEGVR